MNTVATVKDADEHVIHVGFGGTPTSRKFLVFSKLILSSTIADFFFLTTL